MCADVAPTPVREVMQPGVVSVPLDEPLVGAIETMNANAIGSVVVVEDDLIEGIVTTQDVLQAAARTDGRLDKLTVHDAMSTPVVTIPPFTGIEDVLRAMAHWGLHRMPVVYEGRMVGMVTEHDILDRFPELAAVARSFDTALSTAHTDMVRLAGRCHGCGHSDVDLAEVDDHHYCHRCAGGARLRAAPA